MTRRAEIVGAGFAGLAAATTLAQAGWSVRLHERDPVPRTIGSGLYVATFAQKVLRALGLFDRFAALAFAPATRAIHIDGECRSVADIGGQFMATTRAKLYGLLLDTAREAGVVIATGSPVQGVEPEGAVLLEGGRSLAADLVVVADGVRSGLTPSLGIEVNRVQHPDGIIRVLLDRRGMHGPEWDGVIDAYDYRIRPLRMLYSPLGEDAFYFCLMAPGGDAQGAAVPVDAPMWSASFPLFAPAIARIGAAGRHDRYSTTTLSRWSAGRVAVVGDAAHVMPSSLGQGAGVSMLNAVTLARSVADAADVPAALAGWEVEMRPVVEAWQRRAEAVASSRHLSGARHPGTDFDAEKPSAVPKLPHWLQAGEQHA